MNSEDLDFNDLLCHSKFCHEVTGIESAPQTSLGKRPRANILTSVQLSSALVHPMLWRSDSSFRIGGAWFGRSSHLE